jgi:hypothetical protein
MPPPPPPTTTTRAAGAWEDVADRVMAWLRQQADFRTGAGLTTV